MMNSAGEGGGGGGGATNSGGGELKLCAVRETIGGGMLRSGGWPEICTGEKRGIRVAGGHGN